MNTISKENTKKVALILKNYYYLKLKIECLELALKHRDDIDKNIINNQIKDINNYLKIVNTALSKFNINIQKFLLKYHFNLPKKNQIKQFAKYFPLYQKGVEKEIELNTDNLPKQSLSIRKELYSILIDNGILNVYNIKDIKAMWIIT